MPTKNARATKYAILNQRFAHKLGAIGQVAMPAAHTKGTAHNTR
jgi:hypothetical protein